MYMVFYLLSRYYLIHVWDSYTIKHNDRLIYDNYNYVIFELCCVHAIKILSDVAHMVERSHHLACERYGARYPASP